GSRPAAAAGCSVSTRRALLAGVVAFLTAGCAAAGGGFTATGPSTITPSGAYRVETPPRADKGGRPGLSGGVGGGGRRPRVLLEGRDAAGKPIAQQLIYVDQDMSAGHAYFQVRPNTPGLSY